MLRGRRSTANAVIVDYHRLRRAGREAKALEILEDGAARFPDDAGLAIRLAAEVVANSPDDDEAQERARTLTRRAVEYAGDDPSILIPSAEILLSLGEVDEAASAVDRVLKRPSDPGTSGRFASRLLYLSGEFAWERGDLAEAERSLRAAYEMDPTVIGNGHRLARLLASEGRLQEASAVIEDALQYLPSDPALERARVEFAERRSAET